MLSRQLRQKVNSDIRRVVNKEYLIIIILGVFLFGHFVGMAFRMSYGDDLNFVTQSGEYSLLEWVYTRFMTHSGRLAAEVFIWIFARMPLFCWKIVTLFIFLLLGIYFYKYSIMFGNEPSVFMAILCTMAPFLMNQGAFVDASLWVNGAMNYMWIAVPGIVGMYYVVKELFEENYTISQIGKVIVFLLLSITVSSSEQMGAVIIVLLFCLNLWLLINKKIDKYKILLTISMLALLIIDVMLAPGVALRTEKAIAKRIPDFLTVDMVLRIEYSIRWIMDALVNHMGLLLNIVWLLIIFLLLKKSNKKIWDKVVVAVLTIVQLLTLFKNAIPMLFEFEAVWGLQSFSKQSYCAIGFWIVVLFTTAIGVFLACNSWKKKIISELLLLAVYATTAIMVVSPTMYASGCRVMYHSSLLMVILSFMLLSDLDEKIIDKEVEKRGGIPVVRIVMWVMLACALYQYMGLYTILSAGFRIHLPW